MCARVCTCVPWGSLTVSRRVPKDLLDFLVGGVLAQGTHDVRHLAEGHLAVTDSVEETEGLLEVWRAEVKSIRSFTT